MMSDAFSSASSYCNLGSTAASMNRSSSSSRAARERLFKQFLAIGGRYFCPELVVKVLQGRVHRNCPRGRGLRVYSMVLRLFQTVEACSLAIRVLATVRVDAHTALPPGLYFTNVRGRQRGFKLAHSRQGLPGAGKVD